MMQGRLGQRRSGASVLQVRRLLSAYGWAGLFLLVGLFIMAGLLIAGL